jgi:hypothetical protein
MKKALKNKKTLKRLDRVEALLSKVIDHVADELGVRDLLESARSSVGLAKAKAKPVAKKAKPPAKKAKSRAKAKSAAKTIAPLKAKTSKRKSKSSKTARSAKRLRKATTEDSMRVESPTEDVAAV